MLEKHGFKSAGFCGLKNYKGKRVYPKAPEAPQPPDAPKPPEPPKPVPDR
jgi:hypothetical protein